MAFVGVVTGRMYKLFVNTDNAFDVQTIADQPKYKSGWMACNEGESKRICMQPRKGGTRVCSHLIGQWL